MQITVNSQPMNVRSPLNLDELLGQLTGQHQSGIALAVNDQIISRSGWATCQLQEGDRVMLIEAAAGG